LAKLTEGAKQRVDVQSTIYSTIRYAYSTSTVYDDKAHAIVERRLRQFASPPTSILYVDGDPAQEKKETHQARADIRLKALSAAAVSADHLLDLVQHGQRIRKQHSVAVEDHLRKAFEWPLTAREGLIKYLRSQHWHVVECPTEADVEIGRVCGPNDIVVSGDSDLIMYKKVHEVWRPWSKGRFLQYRIDDILKTLNLCQAQWATLGIVSANDYNKNLYGLGIASNFSIVKDLKGSVVVKNADPTKFDTAIKVFIKCQQSPVPKDDVPKIRVPKDDVPSWETIRTKYNSTKQEYIDRKINQKVKIRTSTGTDVSTARHHTHNIAHPIQCLQPRPRYSFKRRTQRVLHDPPESMKRYKWKPYRDHAKSSTDAIPLKKKTKSLGIKPPLTSDKKIDILRAMSWEHPTSTLSMGTLMSSVKKVVTDTNMVSDIMHCLRQAVKVASEVKRLDQKVIGLYLESIFVKGLFEESDRAFLDHLCKRVDLKSFDGNDDEDGATEELDSVDDDLTEGSEQDQFLGMFLRYLLRGENPRKTALGAVCRSFISRLERLGIKFDAPRNPLCLPSKPVTRSVAKQLDVEFKNHFRNGTKALYKRLQEKQDKGIIPKEMALEIRCDRAAIENFFTLNAIDGNSRILIPVSPQKHGFVAFTETEMVIFFWKKASLKAKLQELARPTFSATRPENLSQNDCCHIWLSGQGLGRLIEELITVIDPQGLTPRQKGKAGYSAAIRVKSLQQLRDQVNVLRQPGFDPRDYSDKGYVLRGSIRTNGFRFSLLAFKIRELQSVRYQRYPAHLLPSRLLSTTGGTDSFLTEVRNVIRNQQDIQNLFGCPPDLIKILSIDLGHACLVGSHLLLPEPDRLGDDQQQSKEYNHLAVKTKAVYQPILKLRSWMNMAKHRLLEDVPSATRSEAEQLSSAQIQSVSIDGSDVGDNEVAGLIPYTGLPESEDKDNKMSINSIESLMPVLRGRHANISAYFAYLQTCHDHLNSFYNGDKYQFQRHTWDAEKAMEEEFSKVTNSLLRAVGGSIGAKRDPDNKVVIAIGMAKFDWNKGLTSLDTSFRSYFINKARSLGYLVVGINEHYTSQKCPTCHEFVARVGKSYRRLYCKKCHKKMHRDTMAAHNMCNSVREHLLHQRRPLYLQPRRQDGTYPWTDGAGSARNAAVEGSSRKRKENSLAKSQTKKHAPSSQAVDPLQVEMAAAEGSPAPPSRCTAMESIDNKHANDPQTAVPPKQPSKSVGGAHATVSGSITAETGTTGRSDESSEHSASRPKQPEATKDSTKHKAEFDYETEPNKPRAAKRVAKQTTKEDPVATAGARVNANNNPASTAPSRNT
ncbi:hypothetical protein BGZ98_001276, partial [Dissophora globulifera]